MKALRKQKGRLIILVRERERESVCTCVEKSVLELCPYLLRWHVKRHSTEVNLAVGVDARNDEKQTCKVERGRRNTTKTIRNNTHELNIP